jgi:PST family polysaccharide transporter
MNNILNIQNRDIKVVVKNFASLSVLQLVNNLLPIITMPYLVRTLGPDKYGLISYAQAIMQYFVNLTDYGFNLTATKDISVNRDDKSKIIKIFNSVMLIKIGLMTVSLGILCALVALVPSMRSEWMVYLITFGMVAGNVMFPTWFFQGIEDMKYITIINVIAKFIFTIGIFVLVKSKADYLFVPLLYTLGFILSGIIALYIIFKEFHMKLELPHYEDIKYQLKEGWQVFLSTIMIALNSNSNIVILGIISSNTYVGYYSAGEKLIRAIQRMLMPVQQAVFPYLNRITENKKDGSIQFLRKLTLIIGSFTLMVSLVLLVSSDIINNLLLGSNFVEAIGVFKVLSFFIFFNAVGSIFGMQTMLAFNFKKEFTRIIFLSSIVNIVSCVALTVNYKQIGCAWSVLITEVFILIAAFIFINKKGIKLFQ